jgi:hypothetical protein
LIQGFRWASLSQFIRHEGSWGLFRGGAPWADATPLKPWPFTRFFWTAAGLPVERGLTGVTSIPNDVLPAQRSYAEMHNYLRWEEELGHKYE